MRAVLIGPDGHLSCLEKLKAAYRLEAVAHFPEPGTALAFVRAQTDAPEVMVVDVSTLRDPTMDHTLVQLLDAAALHWPGCRVAVVLGESQQYLQPELQHANARVFRPGQVEDGSAACPAEYTEGASPKGKGCRAYAPQVPEGDTASLAVATYLNLSRRQEVQARIALALSAKGGVGKTTLVANLATALVVQHGLRVAVVDGDLTRGDLARLLGVEPSTTLLDLVADRTPGGIRAVLDRYLVHLLDGHSSAERSTGLTPGLRGTLALLPAPGGNVSSGQPWTALTTRHAQAILTALSSRFDVVLLDTPPDLQRSSPFPAAVIGDGGLPFLALVVVQPQPMERWAARQVLDSLRVAAHPSLHGQVRGVLIDRNRAAGNAAHLERVLGVQIVATVPYDPQAATAQQATDLVYDFGKKRLSRPARAYADLARWVAEGEEKR